MRHRASLLMSFLRSGRQLLLLHVAPALSQVSSSRRLWVQELPGLCQVVLWTTLLLQRL